MGAQTCSNGSSEKPWEGSGELFGHPWRIMKSLYKPYFYSVSAKSMFGKVSRNTSRSWMGFRGCLGSIGILVPLQGASRELAGTPLHLPWGFLRGAPSRRGLSTQRRLKR